ncbi:PleD family two-component system response regulator [Pendulispora albinea]|uniref:Response regulator n=1 Tax=Pendulispora albinea TaxID=2741071 RepID=A0ABZ2LM26_9BACT
MALASDPKVPPTCCSPEPRIGPKKGSVPPKGNTAPSTPLKILVVDDHGSFREMLREIIVGLGHECRIARDGLEAWEMLQAERADVVLSDWQMPRMNGADLCSRIRSADGEFNYTYFVLLTGLADKAHFLRAMEAGADGCYTKCIDPDEIQAHLVSAGRIVALHRRASAGRQPISRSS